jgi:hypothetical protein
MYRIGLMDNIELAKIIVKKLEEKYHITDSEKQEDGSWSTWPIETDALVDLVKETIDDCVGEISLI